MVKMSQTLNQYEFNWIELKLWNHSRSLIKHSHKYDWILHDQIDPISQFDQLDLFDPYEPYELNFKILQVKLMQLHYYIPRDELNLIQWSLGHK